MSEEVFELKKEHITLLKNSWVIWYDCEFGAPGIDCKRPYGNSSIYEDMADILGIELFEDQYGEKHLSEEQADYLYDLHKDLEIALQLILTFQTFEPGTYTRENSWDDWEPV